VVGTEAADDRNRSRLRQVLLFGDVQVVREVREEGKAAGILRVIAFCIGCGAERLGSTVLVSHALENLLRIVSFAAAQTLRLDSTCTVLGLFEKWDCAIEERRIFSGDTLALYTDGITESFNETGEEFGEQRLIESLRRHREQSPSALIASIVEDVSKFSAHEQSDDITLIVAKGR
jgi:hypothetical protein